MVIAIRISKEARPAAPKPMATARVRKAHSVMVRCFLAGDGEGSAGGKGFDMAVPEDLGFTCAGVKAGSKAVKKGLHWPDGGAKAQF